jgi:hypothetical protein
MFWWSGQTSVGGSLEVESNDGPERLPGGGNSATALSVRYGGIPGRLFPDLGSLLSKTGFDGVRMEPSYN